MLKSKNMRYHIITLGCQMNKSDSERIATVLESAGYKKSPTLKGASLVVINMCSVRQAAVDKVKNQILNIKNINKKSKIIITGCILKTDKEKLAPLVDYILSIKDLANWPKILSSRYPILREPKNRISGTSQNRISPTSLNYLKTKPNYQTFPKAFVPISFGCNNFCSYCVVPYTRGPEMHRPEKEILKEIKELIAKKYNHITLLGENVNSYQNKIKDQKSKILKTDKNDFVELLRKITAIRGDFKVNFMAANPHNFTDELINEVAKNPKLEKYLHLPLQSGDNAILKKMKRPYTREQYLKLIAKIKKQIPNVKIVTDVIVGFPGETEKQFQKTVDIMKKTQFYQAYIAKYSPRIGTSAFYMKDNVTTKEKIHREQELRKITFALH
ncbi:MAG: MiaB/RimO family radical SAM methylthiotransferase [Candidatus Pacebacteria bacterium]|nr:MiaB/RimO family radical SAM methylthiotransferase [Candidatus Paceibacterota bacterium]